MKHGRFVAALPLVFAVACESPLVLPDAGRSDAAIEAPPAAPQLDALPDRIPYPLATFRGRAPGARRVLLRGGPNPVTTTVLPDGSFCLDVRLSEMRDYDFSLFSQGTSGVLSTSPTTANIRYDASAPRPVSASTCSGSDPVACSLPGAEICDNGRDDDCDGRADERDADCATCDDDALEPNDDTSAPAISPGRYDGLQICPGNDDYFRVRANAGETVRATLLFVHAGGDLDLALYAANGTDRLAVSETSDDDETLSFTATETGFYTVLVYGYEDAANSYSLDLAVTR